MARRDKGGKKESPAAAIERGKITFSFEFFDTNTDRYCLSNGTPEQIKAVMLRLRQINEKTLHELLAERKVSHFHPIDWDKTTEQGGFPDARANAMEPFQFALLGVNGQLTRVYGGLYRDTFYIVWIDWNHEIWPSLKRHT